MNQRDDIILGGKDREEHNRGPKNTESKFNRENEFDKTFFGHLYTSEGLKPDPRKIEAVMNRNPAKNLEEFLELQDTLTTL